MQVHSTLALYARALERVVLTCNGEPLAEEDAHLFRFALTLRVSLLWDLPYPTADAVNAAYRALLSISEIDVARYGADIKSVNIALRRVIASESRPDARAFARTLGLTYRGLIFGGFYHIVDDYLQCPDQFGHQCLTCFDFVSKLTLRSVDFEAAMLKDYYETEARIAEWRYPDDIMSELNAICNELLCDFPKSELVYCQHGPGSTLEFRGSAHGAVCKGFSAVVDSQTAQVLTDFGVHPDDLTVGQQMVHYCEVVFVPKSMTSKRVISMEETSMQMVQQAVKERVYAYCDRSDWWRMILTFKDQEPSQRLALAGSVDGSYATLDLTAASDSVSVELVDRLFAGTALHEVLLATRSEYALVNGVKTLLKKFAPMGSATCFLAVSIICCVCLEYCRRRSGSRRLFRVFGDDLVVPREYVEEVLKVLRALGFVVNERKSFVDAGRDIFREACGVEAINGRNVTPMRLSRQFRWETPYCSTRRITPAEFASAVGFANRCFELGWRGPRAFVLRSLSLRMDTRLIPRGPRATLLDFESNRERLPSRYSKSLQKCVYSGYVLKPDVRHSKAEKRRLKIDDERLYHHWLFTHRNGGPALELPDAALDWFLKTGNHRLQLRPQAPTVSELIPVGQRLVIAALQDDGLDR